MPATPAHPARTPTPARPARDRAQLVLSDVSLTRGTRRVLAHVDLTVGPASRIAVVGENGRGKSSLLNVLAGTLAPAAGTVRRIGTIGIAEQELSTADDRTVGQLVALASADARRALDRLSAAAEALSADAGPASRVRATAASGLDSRGCVDPAEEYAAALAEAEALDAWEAERRVEVALEGLNARYDPDLRLSELSVGQRSRIRLACLLGGADDFLLLDEPTNHLDAAALAFLGESLRSRRGGVVLVSHDRALLADAADTFVDLDPSVDGRPRVTGGGLAEYLRQSRAARARWEQRYAREAAERARLEADLVAARTRLVSGWRPEKGTAKHQRATRAPGLVQSAHRRGAALEAHAVGVPVPPQALRFPDLPVLDGQPLVAAAGIAASGRLERPFSVSMGSGDRILLTGPNGAGKSTILSILAGEAAPDAGTVARAPAARIGFLRQESELPEERRAGEWYATRLGRLVARGVITEAEADALPLEALGLLGAAEAEQRIGELSTGCRRRLDLALILAARPHLLLLDEPTNHLSIRLVDELTDAIRATLAAVVLATHDRQLRRDLSDWEVREVGGPS